MADADDQAALLLAQQNAAALLAQNQPVQPPPGPGPLDGAQQMANALIASHAQLLADAQAARQEKKLYSRIVPCGGEDEKVTREWVREIDAAERQVPGSGVTVALVTARGELKRALLGLVELQPPNHAL
jgi:hypothetical protein